MPTETTLVPLRHRIDGWTPRRQRAFLAALAQTRSVTRSARAVGLSRNAAYRLRGHPAARDFAAAWDAVMASPRPVRGQGDVLPRRAELSEPLSPFAQPPAGARPRSYPQLAHASKCALAWLRQWAD